MSDGDYGAAGAGGRRGRSHEALICQPAGFIKVGAIVWRCAIDSVNLGRSGLKVTPICLGTAIFGSECREENAVRIMDCAEELGINFIDTADVYPAPADISTAGQTEAIVGRWLKNRRQHFVVATKCGYRVGFGANDAGLSRKHIVEACDASLRRLQTHWLDVLYLHMFDATSPLDETLEAVDRLVRAGKVLYVGVSNFDTRQLALTLAVVAELKLTQLTTLQPRFSLLNRAPQRDLLPLAHEAGVGVFAYNPLGGGVLAGKYPRTQLPPEGSRFAAGDYGKMYRDRYWSEAAFDVADAVAEVGRNDGLTAAQVAIAWALSQRAITGVAVGASRPEQLRDAVGALDRKLSADALARLEVVSLPFL